MDMNNEMGNFWKGHNKRVDTGEAVGRKMPQEGYNSLEDPNNKETLIQIARRIKILVRHYEHLGEGFIFFGSRVRGSYHSGSDFDIIVPSTQGELCTTLSRDMSSTLSRQIHVNRLYPSTQLYGCITRVGGEPSKGSITVLAYLYIGIAFGKCGLYKMKF